MIIRNSLKDDASKKLHIARKNFLKKQKLKIKSAKKIHFDFDINFK